MSDGQQQDLFEGRFQGPEQFAQLVRDALAAAAREGWRELLLSDPGFTDWPLGEREVVDALRGLKYTATAVLDEGILFWRDKGYPLAGEAVKSGAASAKPGGGLAPLAPASAAPAKPAPAAPKSSAK